MSERRRIITQIKALLAELESDAPLAPSAPSAPEPAPADGWKRARLGKVFLNAFPDGTPYASAYVNWREGGEERSEKPSTKDHGMMKLLQDLRLGDNIEYQTETTKKGYLNFTALRRGVER